MKIEAFCVIGIAIRTTNQNGRSAEDIPRLWNQFMAEKIMEKIPGKISTDIYCVYTDYEKDFTKPYTTLLGCKVNETSPVPEGCTKIVIPVGNYQLHTAKGNILEGIVFKEWTVIWNAALKRAYTADFEVYGEKARHPTDAEVDIFVATG